MDRHESLQRKQKSHSFTKHIVEHHRGDIILDDIGRKQRNIKREWFWIDETTFLTGKHDQKQICKLYGVMIDKCS